MEWTFRLINDRADRQCEYTWYSDCIQYRCPEKHGEPGVNMRGNVDLSLSEGYKVLCQRHALQTIQNYSEIGGGKARKKVAEKNQIDLFGAVA